MKSTSKNKVAVVALATIATVGLGGYLGASAVMADDLTPPMTLSERIAEAFNLNQDEVDAVLQADRDERETLRLEHAVENGVITEDQIAVINAKRDEFQADMDDINSQELTVDERHDAVQALMDEYSIWADENNIPVGMVAGGPKGMGSGMGGGMKGSNGQGMGGNGMGIHREW